MKEEESKGTCSRMAGGNGSADDWQYRQRAEEAEEVTYKLYPESSGNDVSGWKLHPEKECQCHLYDEDIDDATKARLEETAELKGLNVTESDAEKSGATNIYVGVYGSDGTVDDQIVDEYAVDTSLFVSYRFLFPESDNNTIAVLGKRYRCKFLWTDDTVSCTCTDREPVDQKFYELKIMQML